MVVLMASAAAAAASAASGRKVFEYNRKNFLEDREQRMRKEFAERKFRVTQAGLWREDVRSFVSLTEKKMSLYLLVGVLLLSFNVNLWVEGRLPEETAEWLTMGMQIAIAVSFLFLLLAVWLAMHAAVAAQAYQTRVLTQLVRLPIPSWEELESCRTAGSDFERLEPQQMFRVPFVTKKQEEVAASHAPLPTIAEGAAEASMAKDFDAPRSHPTMSSQLPAADPWGLERSGTDIYELGAHYGESVAKLRHIKLMRQAAVYWQTYDAFARVSMSVGTNQLLLAMSYYILGYTMAQVRAPVAAWAGVSILVFATFLLAQVDLTLSLWEKHLFHICLAFGPVVASLAVYRWSQHSVFAEQVADLLAPLAFISHGMVVGLMTLFVKVRTQENGAIVPLAFQKVLFLDVFGWVWHKHTQPDQFDATSIAATEEWPRQMSSATSAAEGGLGLSEDSRMSHLTPHAAVGVASAAVLHAAPKARPGQAPSYASTATQPPQTAGSPEARRTPLTAVSEASGVSGSSPDILGYYADDYLSAPRQGDTDTDRRFGDNSLQWDAPDAGSDTSEGHRGATRPALGAIVYDELGQPIPTRPDDAKLPDSVHDMRLVSGAPRMWDQVNAIEPPGRQFWDPVSFMPPDDRTRRMIDTYFDGQGRSMDPDGVDSLSILAGDLKDAEIETGHDREAPGLVPWRIFQNAAGVTSMVWIFAGVYWMLRATNMVSKDWMQWLGTDPDGVEDSTAFVDLSNGGFVVPSGVEGKLNATSWRALEGAVPAAWPYPSMAPTGLACDASGRHMLVLDGVSVYHADLGDVARRATAGPEVARSLLGKESQSTLRRKAKASDDDAAHFAAVAGCEALRGRALDDAAIACGDRQEQCEVVVLHSHGRQITSCLLTPGGRAEAEAAGATSDTADLSAPITTHWLRNGELMRWLVLDPNCAADISAGATLKAGCVSVATTHGRIAQLQLSALSGQLNPDDIFDTSAAARKRRSGTRGGADRRARQEQASASGKLQNVRSVGAGAVGLLQSSERDVRIMEKEPRSVGERLAVTRVRWPIDQAVGSFCVGGSEIYMLEQGSSPTLWRFPFPDRFGPQH